LREPGRKAGVEGDSPIFAGAKIGTVPGAKIGTVSGATVEAEEDAALVKTIRIVLSGVARVRQDARFDCGKTLLAQMLCGSDAARMEKLRLKRLSTYGLLGHLIQSEVVELVDGLVATGHLDQVYIEPGRPVLQLTELGRQVMQGSASFDSRLPISDSLLVKLTGGRRAASVADGDHRESGAFIEPPADEPVDPDLLARLKAWRREKAEERSLPPHYILTNATLDELVRRRPGSHVGLLSVKGIGQRKVGQFGDELLAILGGAGAGETSASGAGFQSVTGFQGVKEHGQDGHTTEMPTEECAPLQVNELPPGPPEVLPAHYWTWRLLESGFSLAECEAIRGLARGVLLDHALRAAEQGWPVPIENCLEGPLLAALGQAVPADALDDRGAVEELLWRLPEGTRPEEVRLYLQCRSK